MTELKPYSELIKIDEKSNKIYKIFMEQLNKGDLINTDPPRITNKSCHQVYIQSGKIDGVLKTHFYKTFFSYTAADRFSKQLQNSKIQAGYNIKGIESPVRRPVKIIKKAKKEIEPLFESLPKQKYQISSNQKTRFSEILK